MDMPSVTPNEQHAAITDWSDDRQWAQREGEQITMGVRRRLAAVNRALFASARIAEMLFRDHLGKDDAEAHEGVVHHGFSPLDAEALMLAMIELNSHAEAALEDVRENEHGRGGATKGAESTAA